MVHTYSIGGLRADSSYRLDDEGCGRRIPLDSRVNVQGEFEEKFVQNRDTLQAIVACRQPRRVLTHRGYPAGTE